MRILTVFVASTITALCTGLGVLPFLLSQKIGKRWLGLGNGLAAGLMMGASIGLVWEAGNLSFGRTVVGVLLGAALIFATRWMLPDKFHDQEELVGGLSNADFRKMMLVMVVMTVHSFAEGIGVGVSFSGREGFGNLISAAIAVHNIPEGLAIGLVMIPRGVSIAKAGMWSVVSSLPQPLMAVPAFLFVLAFEPLLPAGLGLAAGAMIYMVIFELLPEAIEQESTFNVGAVFLLAIGAMLFFQFQLS